jgi:hypothetical protein
VLLQRRKAYATGNYLQEPPMRKAAFSWGGCDR